jgi:Secretion system C-terminal sorting domain
MLSNPGVINFSFPLQLNSVTVWDNGVWHSVGNNVLNTGDADLTGDLIVFSGELFACGPLVNSCDSLGWLNVFTFCKFAGSLTSIIEHAESEYLISPNPANNNITVTWAIPNVNTLTLSDATGRTVRTYSVSGTQAQLSLEGLARGVYYLRDEDGYGIAEKVVVER